MVVALFLSKLPDSPDIKSFKKFPLTLRLVILVVVVLCGIYICTIILEQKGVHTSAKLLGITVFKQPCYNHSGVEEWELPYLHYPEPKIYSREECACNPVLFFCIVSMQRSGSGWFETFLNSHINVSSKGEIFSVGKRRANVSSILETMDKNECTAAVGFKLMLNQGLMEHHEEIVEYFERRRVSVIFLFRRNLLRRMISVVANSYDKDAKPLNGTHKSHVHSRVETTRFNITLLIPELNQTKETAAKAIAYFKNTGHIVLYYEDLKLKDVQEFLRVPYRDLESRQVKIHTAALSKQIENWDEVQESLAGTPYQRFLLKD
ncbi:hypothetical protein AAZX31_06G035800 [Glycine max]